MRTQDGSEEDLLALVNACPDKVTLNDARTSLQVKGACPAVGLIANLPLAPAEFREVQSVLARDLSSTGAEAGE